MDWDGFRYFTAAADAGSLSAAAVLLDSNQSTVGRHIDALESALAIKLFQRSVKGLSLTEEGQAVYEQAQQIQNSIVKIQRLVQGGDDIATGPATVFDAEDIDGHRFIARSDDHAVPPERR